MEICAENLVENFRAFRILSRNSFRSLRRNFLRFFGSLCTNFTENNQLFSEVYAEIFHAFSEVCAEIYSEINQKFLRFFGSLCRNFIQKLAKIKASLLFFRKIIKQPADNTGLATLRVLVFF